MDEKEQQHPWFGEGLTPPPELVDDFMDGDYDEDHGIEDNDGHKYIVLEGNVIDGLTFHGPFDDSNEATEWASENIEDSWQVAELHPE